VTGFWVGVGGGLGAIGRFLMGGWVGTWAFAGFPWGTFAVNVIGSAALGFVARAWPAPATVPGMRAFFTVGLCGGFTTFSTFDFETLALLQRGDHATAALYSLGSVTACVAGVAGGVALAARWSQGRDR
jgi:fluoride exporter